jgi:hypothetical protein
MFTMACVGQSNHLGGARVRGGLIDVEELMQPDGVG